ncbi:MAG: glutamate-1-semialdehyde 2,1-aminomutase [Oligoflexia bacterium]|nr:glutamate-1-semialdehyde 2,1-aminomutase [Oligoflexia bacterium]
MEQPTEQPMSDNNNRNISSELFAESTKIVPGGVHSPVRGFKGLNTTPIFIKRAAGAYVYDVDDNSYVDFCMSFGPLILGHKDPDVEQELHVALERGWTYGAAEEYSLKLAKYIIDRIPFIEQIRFMNSGTEAVMTAIRLARAYSRKNKIIKFSGCYHGHTDSMLIKAGSGVTQIADASSKGIPHGVVADTIVLPLGNCDLVEKTFERFKDDIAAIIIEPLPANNGLLIQDTNFLRFLRDITKAHDALLIFDEVISGFRVCFGGMSELLKITPDIVTYGKVIGGGLPVGAVAGPAKIMQMLAPVGDVYQAGTLSANPLAMVAGLTTLKKLNQNFYEKLNSYTNEIRDTFNNFLNHSSACAAIDCKLEMISYQSLFWITSAEQTSANISRSFAKLFDILIAKGIYLAPNAYEVGFVSIAHDKNVIIKLNNLLND